MKTTYREDLERSLEHGCETPGYPCNGEQLPEQIFQSTSK